MSMDAVIVYIRHAPDSGKDWNDALTRKNGS